jgi:hypothetical protein
MRRPAGGSRAKEFASLIFPLGSRIPGRFELLEGTGLQRMIRSDNVEAVGARSDELLDIVDTWCSITGDEATPKMP